MTNSRIALHILAASFVVISASAHSQAPASATANAKPLAFDAISIKPDNANTGVTNQVVNGEAVISSRSMIRNLPDGFIASNINAKTLISNAYGIKDDLITGGPDWISSTGYDIDAKVTSFDSPDVHQLTRDQHNQMLQSLLADRFHLVVHNETKDAPIYELTLAKGGPKLVESKPSDTPPQGSPAVPPGAVVKTFGAPISGPLIRMMPGQFSAQAMSVAQLADMLSRQLHRTVIDRTGLTGKYDITLKYTPDSSPASADAADAGPSIFTALQEQLGLKLDASKGPVKTLVIDHIERPSEN